MITKQRQSILDQDPTVTGFNVGINVGASAGQTVFHVHVHLIPKSGGACHNSLEIGISNADPCYTAAVWERVDTLLAKQRAATRKYNKIKQAQKKSVSKQPESAKSLDLKKYQIKLTGQNSTKQRRVGMKFLGIVVIVVIFFGALDMGGGLDKAIDLMSLIFVIGVAVGHALGAKDGENKITRFGDGCVRGGWLAFLMGVSLIAGSDIAAAMDFGSLMPAMAVALLPPLYGYFFKIITMQLE